MVRRLKCSCKRRMCPVEGCGQCSRCGCTHNGQTNQIKRRGRPPNTQIEDGACECYAGQCESCKRCIICSCDCQGLPTDTRRTLRLRKARKRNYVEDDDTSADAWEDEEDGEDIRGDSPGSETGKSKENQGGKEINSLDEPRSSFPSGEIQKPPRKRMRVIPSESQIRSESRDDPPSLLPVVKAFADISDTPIQNTKLYRVYQQISMGDRTAGSFSDVPSSRRGALKQFIDRSLDSIGNVLAPKYGTEIIHEVCNSRMAPDSLRIHQRLTRCLVQCYLSAKSGSVEKRTLGAVLSCLSYGEKSTRVINEACILADDADDADVDEIENVPQNDFEGLEKEVHDSTMAGNEPGPSQQAIISRIEVKKGLNRARGDLMALKAGGSLGKKRSTPQRHSVETVEQTICYMLDGERIKSRSWGTHKVLIEDKMMEIPKLMKGFTRERMYRDYKYECSQQNREYLGRKKFMKITKALRTEAPRYSSVDDMLCNNFRYLKKIVNLGVPKEHQSFFTQRIDTVLQFLENTYRLDHLRFEKNSLCHPLHDGLVALEQHISIAEERVTNKHSKPRNSSSCPRCTELFRLHHDILSSLSVTDEIMKKHGTNAELRLRNAVLRSLRMTLRCTKGLIRCQNQQRAISSALQNLMGDEVLVVADLNMNFELMPGNGKRMGPEERGSQGMNWHSAALYVPKQKPNNCDKHDLFYLDQVVQTCSTQTMVVMSCLESLLKSVYENFLLSKSVILQCNTVKHCTQEMLLLGVAAINAHNKCRSPDYPIIKRIIFTGKEEREELIDAHFSTMMRLIAGSANDGRPVDSAIQLFNAICGSTEVRNTIVELLQINNRKCEELEAALDQVCSGDFRMGIANDVKYRFQHGFQLMKTWAHSHIGEGEEFLVPDLIAVTANESSLEVMPITEANKVAVRNCQIVSNPEYEALKKLSLESRTCRDCGRRLTWRSMQFHEQGYCPGPLARVDMDSQAVFTNVAGVRESLDFNGTSKGVAPGTSRWSQNVSNLDPAVYGAMRALGRPGWGLDERNENVVWGPEIAGAVEGYFVEKKLKGDILSGEEALKRMELIFPYHFTFELPTALLLNDWFCERMSAEKRCQEEGNQRSNETSPVLEKTVSVSQNGKENGAEYAPKGQGAPQITRYGIDHHVKQILLKLFETHSLATMKNDVWVPLAMNTLMERGIEKAKFPKTNQLANLLNNARTKARKNGTLK
eukprot:Plantae.Rhodophyta-Hildenbrandia_rubra.ctg968.p1 GENE.Plantae.Rhodophyta-Hildenbrandia_rubra.ctg968~~Plantae.Rhodophyta-Hildenbrandia_rubra.ctg968.p1  ORF type:complete len:1209 (+),score=171.03 Plantae.Rhodophyta-Hildenbrandia_rubra.ctg968:1860-5486(+)